MGCEMGFRAQHHMRAFDEAAADTAPGPRQVAPHDDEEADRLRAAGVPRQYTQPIDLTLDRTDFGRLLEFIEQRAVRSENYLEVRQAVLFSELLREQARKQGY